MQAQRDANGVNQRQIPEDEHLTIVEAKDKRIEELVSLFLSLLLCNLKFELNWNF